MRMRAGFAAIVVFSVVPGWAHAQAVQRPLRPYAGWFGGGPPPDPNRTRQELTLQGSVLGSRSEWNRAYYGRDFAARQIVIDMAGRNQGAEPLRDVLTRSGAVHTAAVVPAPVPVAEPSQTAPRGTVQRQNLAPPRH